MAQSLGYNQPLYLLPFDHRSSFTRGLLSVVGGLNPSQSAQVSELKNIVYRGFELAVAQGVPKAAAAILVDEQFGLDILKQAVAAGYIVCMPVEKSGQEEFDFEYGASYVTHLTDIHPVFAKVLVRYNPEADAELNARQRAKLGELGSQARSAGCKFLAEILVPSTSEQLAKVGGDGGRYDAEIRPGLAVRMIKEFQADGVEPDVWKIEGFDKPADYQAVVQQIRQGERSQVGLIILGRGQDEAAVEQWLKAGREVSGVIGFAVGRTVFWQALVDYRAGKLTAVQASQVIADRYLYFYKLFVGR
jgi:5-dehydro-2-deoxygluconokinase